ncbi:MAG: DUF350 domain-containing protein [Cellulosilyticaceae bacterium]
MQDLIGIVIYSVIGSILMQVGIFLVDAVIPCNFAEEIKKRNVAVGYISAGISIGVGIILKSAVISKTVTEQVETFLVGVGSTVIYFAMGIICFMVGYLCHRGFKRKYDLNKEIGEGNPAAGLMVMGFFIGLGIVISGVIY